MEVLQSFDNQESSYLTNRQTGIHGNLSALQYKPEIYVHMY